jgi:hypothetical protein
MLVVALVNAQPLTLRRLEHEYSFADILTPAWSVRPMGFWRQNGRAVLILDPGGNLLDGAMGAPLELTWVLRVTIGVASSLRELHRCGIVHKDIKPANFLDTGFVAASGLAGERQAMAPPETTSGTLHGSKTKWPDERINRHFARISTRWASLYMKC